MGETAGSGISELRASYPRSGRGKTSSDFDPNTPPVGHYRHCARLLFINAITAILGELLDGVVVGENVAMDAAQERNGNLQDRNKKMIRRFADLPGTH